MNTPIKIKRSDLEGKTQIEALRFLKERGLSGRTARVDGQQYMLTCDVKMDRYNLYIEDGIVVAFTQG